MGTHKESLLFNESRGHAESDACILFGQGGLDRPDSERTNLEQHRVVEVGGPRPLAMH
jgi:hypothetical protein